MPYRERAPLPRTAQVDAPRYAECVVFNTVDTRDIDEQAERLRGWSQEYIQISPGHFAGSLREVWIGDVQVYRERTNCELWERGAVREDSLSIVVQMGADSTAVFNGDEVNTNSVIFCRGGDEWSVRSGKAWDVVSLTVPLARVTPIIGDEIPAPQTALYANLPADARASLHRLVRASELTLDSGAKRNVAPMTFLGLHRGGVCRHGFGTSAIRKGTTSQGRRQSASPTRSILRGM